MIYHKTLDKFMEECPVVKTEYICDRKIKFMCYEENYSFFEVFRGKENEMSENILTQSYTVIPTTIICVPSRNLEKNLKNDVKIYNGTGCIIKSSNNILSEEWRILVHYGEGPFLDQGIKYSLHFQAHIMLAWRTMRIIEKSSRIFPFKKIRLGYDGTVYGPSRLRLAHHLASAPFIFEGSYLRSDFSRIKPYYGISKSALRGILKSYPKDDHGEIINDPNKRIILQFP